MFPRLLCQPAIKTLVSDCSFGSGFSSCSSRPFSYPSIGSQDSICWQMYTLFSKTPSGICSTTSSIFRHHYQPVKKIGLKVSDCPKSPSEKKSPRLKEDLNLDFSSLWSNALLLQNISDPQVHTHPTLQTRLEFFKCFRDTEEILRGNVHIVFRFAKPPTPQLSCTKLYLKWPSDREPSLCGL